MKIPFEIIRLFRKEGILDDQYTKRSLIEDCYDEYNATIDLHRVMMIEEGYLRGVTNIYIKSATVVVAKMNYARMKIALQQGLDEYNKKKLLSYKQ